MESPNAQKDWLKEMLMKFDHPATALWRGVEARVVSQCLSGLEVNSSQSVLDLGCGEGKVSSVIFNRKIDVGVDIFASAIEEAKKLGLYKDLMVGDAQHLTLPNNSFDIVFSNCVIEHIPDVDAVLSETARVLKDQGLLIFTVPSDRFGDLLFFTSVFNGVRLKKVGRWYKTTRNKELDHFHCYSPNEWQKRLDKTGFDLIETKYYISSRAAKLWDFMAAFFFVGRKVAVWRNLGVSKKLTASFLNRTRRARIAAFRRVLKSFYDQDCRTGAGLLVAAKKRSGGTNGSFGRMLK